MKLLETKAACQDANYVRALANQVLVPAPTRNSPKSITKVLFNGRDAQCEILTIET